PLPTPSGFAWPARLPPVLLVPRARVNTRSSRLPPAEEDCRGHAVTLWLVDKQVVKVLQRGQQQGDYRQQEIADVAVRGAAVRPPAGDQNHPAGRTDVDPGLHFLKSLADHPHPVDREPPVVGWVGVIPLDEGHVDMHDPSRLEDTVDLAQG